MRSQPAPPSVKLPEDKKMMSLKTWLVILLVYVGYLLGGGGIFWWVGQIM